MSCSKAFNGVVATFGGVTVVVLASVVVVTVLVGVACLSFITCNTDFPVACAVLISCTKLGAVVVVFGAVVVVALGAVVVVALGAVAVAVAFAFASATAFASASNILVIAIYYISQILSGFIFMLPHFLHFRGIEFPNLLVT
jgi:hypothetical protein